MHLHFIRFLPYQQPHLLAVAILVGNRDLEDMVTFFQNQRHKLCDVEIQIVFADHLLIDRESETTQVCRQGVTVILHRGVVGIGEVELGDSLFISDFIN